MAAPAMLTILPVGVTVPVAPGQSLLEAALAAAEAVNIVIEAPLAQRLPLPPSA